MAGNLYKKVDDLQLYQKADNAGYKDASRPTPADVTSVIPVSVQDVQADSSSDQLNNQRAPTEEGNGSQDNQQYKIGCGTANGSAVTVNVPLDSQDCSGSDQSNNQRAPTGGKGNQEKKQSFPPEQDSPDHKSKNETAKTGSAKVPSTRLQMSLRRLANLLGTSWRKLGIYIGFDNSELDDFSNARPKNYFAETMLSTWARSTEKSKQKQILIEALKQAGRRDLSEEIKELQHKDNAPITQTELSNLADRLGRHMRPLATYLGIASSEIEGFVEDIPVNSIKESAFEMLVAWEENTHEQDKEKFLRKILRDIKRTDLAEHNLWTM